MDDEIYYRTPDSWCGYHKREKEDGACVECEAFEKWKSVGKRPRRLHAVVKTTGKKKNVVPFKRPRRKVRMKGSDEEFAKLLKQAHTNRVKRAIKRHLLKEGWKPEMIENYLRMRK